jgi:hypothetical protein
MLVHLVVALRGDLLPAKATATLVVENTAPTTTAIRLFFNIFDFPPIVALGKDAT